MKNIIKIASISSFAIFSILFSCVIIFAFGHSVGFSQSKSQYLEGFVDGEKKGRYELYIELEQRKLGIYNPKTDRFEFNK
jgi:hypothetical protein